MKTKLIDLLRFLRLVDQDGTLSLTSVALVVVLGKLAMAPTFTLPEIGALLLALASYQSKKVINQRHVESELSEHIADLASKVKAVEGELVGDDGLKARITRTESRAAELMRVPRR
jgi:uncharacterized lipoprotein NlpE involved in copper resistance